MKIFIYILLTCFSTDLFFSQKLTTDYVCLYNLNFKRKNNIKDNEQFILLINKNNNKSFFLSSTNYSPNTNNDSYQSEFNEMVINNQNDYFNILEEVNEVKLHYKEKNNIQWKIQKEKSKINNINVQLATTNIYGRKWFAWFCSDIPFNLGPYKFCNLPGLIISIYDENKNIVFTLDQFKKKKIEYSIPNIKNYKQIDKKDFNTYRFKIATADTGIVIFENQNEKKQWYEKVKERILSVPLLDIEYPIKN